MRSKTGIDWTIELRNLEAEIFKKKKERRIDDIRVAWGIYLRTLEKKSWPRRLFTRLRTVFFSS